MHVNTVGLLILLGLLFEMFTLEATRIKYTGKKTTASVLTTIIGTTALYVGALILGWFLAKWFLRDVTFISGKVMVIVMGGLLLSHALVRERKQFSQAQLFYQNVMFYFGIVFARAIIHIISGAIFYKLDLVSARFFNWILISTTLFSLISVMVSYPNLKILGLTTNRLKIVLYAISFIGMFFAKIP
ncbi:MAG TPA: hypothetical protein PK990_03165 [Salinivirgaceae bacterium]|nr:hypothetical protein [Salinivirgaceae bacterium]